jgi:hypothetical protein
MNLYAREELDGKINAGEFLTNEPLVREDTEEHGVLRILPQRRTKDTKGRYGGIIGHRLHRFSQI